MKKTLLLFVLLVISTTSYAREKEYHYWGSLSNGGMKSIVSYPKWAYLHEKYKINPSSYGKYLGFSVLIKTTNVNNSVYPFIGLLDNKKKNYISIKRGKVITGTTGWKRYYTPRIYVPPHAKWVYTAVQINGAGKVEFYDDQLKEYSYK